MPLEVREDIYEWMIRWLKDGKGNFREEPFEPVPDFDLLASETGQVGGRQVYQVIAESFHQRMSQGSTEQLQAEIRKWAGGPVGHPPSVRVVNDTSGDVFRTQQLALQVEPALEISRDFVRPERTGAEARRPAG